MQLREYQERFVENIARSLKQHGRIVAQLATGGGKTVTFSAIAKRFHDKSGQRVLILVHRMELLTQAARTIKRNTGLEAVPIIAGMKSIPDAPIYVGMVETISRRFDKLPDIGLIIIDEAHIGNFKKVIEHYREKYIIGFTATPLNATKKDPLKNYFNAIVCGIDIPELIDSEYLCKPQTFGPKQEIERAKLKMKAGDFDPVQMAAMYSANKYVQSTVDVYKKHSMGLKTLVFNCSVAHSLLVTEAFQSAGFDCRHLDGESAEREQILKWFADTPHAILCNVFIATTGFDQPDVQTVIINKATASMPMWLQMCGRGSRPTETKKHFTIIDMGANVIDHGTWESQRDWETIFYHPRKAKDGLAPMKKCPECEGYIHARKMVCDLEIYQPANLFEPERYVPCGYEFPVKEIIDPGLDEIIKLAGSIDIDRMISAAAELGHNDYAVIHRIIGRVTDSCRSMNPAFYQTALDQVIKLGADWAKKKGKRYTQWNKDFIKSNFEKQINLKFPQWKKSSSPVTAA